MDFPNRTKFCVSDLRAGGEIKHIRVNNTPNNGYSLGKSKDEYESIWDLVEAQLDKSLKSTKGDDAVQLVYVPSRIYSHRIILCAAEYLLTFTLFSCRLSSLLSNHVTYEQAPVAQLQRGHCT